MSVVDEEKKISDDTLSLEVEQDAFAGKFLEALAGAQVRANCRDSLKDTTPTPLVPLWTCKGAFFRSSNFIHRPAILIPSLALSNGLHWSQTRMVQGTERLFEWEYDVPRIGPTDRVIPSVCPRVAGTANNCRLDCL